MNSKFIINLILTYLIVGVLSISIAEVYKTFDNRGVIQRLFGG